MVTDAEQRYTLTEAAERYRETMVFNNELLKRNYPEWYAFKTKMGVDKERHFGSSSSRIAEYEKHRRERYDKRFKIYCDKLDAQIEPSVVRYVANIRAAFGYD